MKDDDKALLMAIPVTMIPQVKSVRHAGDCGHDVWVSQTMAPHLEDPRFTVKCMVCCLKDSAFIEAMADRKIRVTPEQRAELNKAVGVSTTDQMIAQFGAVEEEL